MNVNFILGGEKEFINKIVCRTISTQGMTNNQFLKIKVIDN